MTREDAIETLRNTAWLGTDKKVGQVEEAIQIAITALEAQDVDAVSRKAVMWMLTNLSYTQCRTQGEVEVIGLAKTLLIAMPSAQEANNSNLDYEDVLAVLSEHLPSAQPDIIRCRDCKHYYYSDNRIPQEQRFVCELEGERWKPDDYCSYAERRTDEQTD